MPGHFQNFWPLKITVITYWGFIIFIHRFFSTVAFFDAYGIIIIISGLTQIKFHPQFILEPHDDDEDDRRSSRSDEATMVVDDHDLRCVLLNIVVVFATNFSSSSTTTTAIVVEAALVEAEWLVLLLVL